MPDDLSAPLLDSFLHRRSLGVIPSLDVIRRLLKLTGGPERSFAAVHVAGTNGKGSVCAMLASILQQAGYRVGLYTSPHLRNFRERIRVDGEPVQESLLRACLQKVEQADRATGLRPATFFEAATAAAFLCFRQAGVDMAVIETGMGGRWDATVLCRPILTVITPIGIDHTEFLGTEPAAIASEKCGILKAGIAALTAEQDEEVMAVIRQEARRRKSPLRRVSDLVRVERFSSGLQGQELVLETTHGRLEIRLPLAGTFQRENSALACAAALMLAEQHAGRPGLEHIRTGLEGVEWPGRFHVVGTSPPVILDGAHNVHAARSLAASLREVLGTTRIAVVAGFLKDKDVEGIGAVLAPHVGSCWTVRPDSERGMDAAEAARRLNTAGIRADPRVRMAEAVEAARRWAVAHGSVVLVTGSLYLVGAVLEMVAAQSCSPSAGAGEARIWQGYS
ncbi:MAG TPA: bifunctional folylpolyglutamate synthase/dihydrofolate synthase [Lentisphaerae bacterium]|nr:bifunctional folylpolyglutamate synthase/dihydrofolate synthase [Lentisphaerota bacterium]